jgi:hypothetical protein
VGAGYTDPSNFYSCLCRINFNVLPDNRIRAKTKRTKKKRNCNGIFHRTRRSLQIKLQRSIWLPAFPAQIDPSFIASTHLTYVTYLLHQTSSQQVQFSSSFSSSHFYLYFWHKRNKSFFARQYTAGPLCVYITFDNQTAQI